MANTYSQIYIQIVFAVRGRQNLIDPRLRGEIHKYITGIVSKRGQKLLAVFCMPDHVHILVAIQPTLDSFGNTAGDFTGREYDSFTGLYYYRARMYDPKLGRFISEDPVGFAGGDVNLYGYVRNNPQNWRDPDGTSPIPTVLIGRFTPVSVDEFQIYLALFGMIPGAGEAADAVDTGISAARGDYCEVGLGVASMAPIGGWGPGLGKLYRRLDKFRSLRSGVYDMSPSGGRYIGQAVDLDVRPPSHFYPSGKFPDQTPGTIDFFEMPGSTRLEREVYEQYRIDRAGIQNLQNILNPMGGRRELYESMFDDVIRKYDLPR